MPLCGNETRSAISCQKAKRVSHPCHFQTIPFPPEANGQLPRQDDLLASVHHTPLHESTIKQAEIENVRSAVSAARRRPSRAVRCPYARVSRLPWITGTRPDVNKSPGSGIVFVRDRPEGDIILFDRHKKIKRLSPLNVLPSADGHARTHAHTLAQCGRKSIFHHDRPRTMLEM